MSSVQHLYLPMIHASSPEITELWECACTTSGIDAGAARHVYTFADPSLARPGVIDEITRLACLGEKRGTAHLRSDFEVNAIPMRSAGDYWVVTDENLDPRCVVRITTVAVQPFVEVGADFAASEGEGDRSLAHWRGTHRGYFQRQCERWGLEWHDRLETVCERFELVYAA